jgi:acylphosphatase
MNRNDGKVEAVFEGQKDDVDSILNWCYKGPSGAVVRDVEIKWEEYTGEFNGFDVRFEQ